MVSKTYFNSHWAYILSGRKIKWNNTISPSNHIICVLMQNSPILNLIIHNTHNLIGCNYRIKIYLNYIRMSGFRSTNLSNTIREHKQYCRMCPLIHQLLAKKYPARILANCHIKSPNHFVLNTLSNDPLQVIQLDKTGPIKISNAAGITKI